MIWTFHYNPTKAEALLIPLSIHWEHVSSEIQHQKTPLEQKLPMNLPGKHPTPSPKTSLLAQPLITSSHTERIAMKMPLSRAGAQGIYPDSPQQKLYRKSWTRTLGIPLYTPKYIPPDGRKMYTVSKTSFQNQACFIHKVFHKVTKNPIHLMRLLCCGYVNIFALMLMKRKTWKLLKKEEAFLSSKGLWSLKNENLK